ncbi:MAG: glycosyltransferase family 39 protein [Myxococcales bacterium]|nr:glycosyltransferase family 39 protein [Polyangiaceae bacterium]MDW8251889.1 glycosyltransferase family 39 protein [Myxococcales bacterium]
MEDASAHRSDVGIALLLGASYVGLLLATVSDLGYARDEGFYFHAAERYAAWLELLAQAPSEALERSALDGAFSTNREHPVLAKILFALSWLAHRRWNIFPDEGTSFRFPGMCFAGLAVGLCYLWGVRSWSRAAGAMAALLFALVPTTFYHGHLACFDVPITAMWLLVAFCYHQSLVRGSWRWALATGVTFGLALNTKHNSWFLPIAFVIHALLSRGAGLRRSFVGGRISLPLALAAMAIVGPLVFVGLWPYVWYDTAARLASYVQFHTHHDYYNIEYLGVTHWKPPFPRSYAWGMTAATVPTVTLVLTMVGAVVGLRTPGTTPGSVLLLWALGVLVNYAPWLSPNTPIFGGTKHWMTAYPFLALFAGVGFDWVGKKLAEAVSEARQKMVPWVVGAMVGSAPLVETLRAHPWGLAAYTPLVGGTPGAATLGLNRSFWGYTTGSVVDVLNERVPPNGTVFVHDTAWESWRMLQRDGRLRQDLRGVFHLDGVDAALYHHEQHMSGVDYQIWVALETTTPTVIRGLDGVPTIWVYLRPGRAPRQEPCR